MYGGVKDEDDMDEEGAAAAAAAAADDDGGDSAMARIPREGGNTKVRGGEGDGEQEEARTG